MTTYSQISDLMVAAEKTQDLKKESNHYLAWQLTDRQICDLELLLNGGFSPLDGFMGKADYNSVLKNMRLDNGALWPMPITLDITEEFASKIKDVEKITLRDQEGFTLAILTVIDIWEPNKDEEAQMVYGTTDLKHPAVNYLKNKSNKMAVGGKLEGISLPHHYDYQKNRHTPEELRSIFIQNGWDKIVAFQTRNPLHRAHGELTMRASEDLNGN